MKTQIPEGVRPHDLFNKTVLMFQPAPGTVYTEPFIYVAGKKSKVINKFTFQGSTISRFCSGTWLWENFIRLKKATDAFSALNNRVWSQRRLRTSTNSWKCTAHVCWHVSDTHVKHGLCKEDIWNNSSVFNSAAEDQLYVQIHWTTHAPDT